MPTQKRPLWSSCKQSPELGVMVHKFALAERVCSCGEVTVPVNESRFGYGAGKNSKAYKDSGQAATLVASQEAEQPA